MPRILVPVTLFFSSIVATTLESSSKKILTPAQNLNLLNELTKDLKKLIKVFCQNLLYAQELQKKAHDKDIKSRSYTVGEKILLNSKYIKTKREKKLKTKLCKPFQILYVVEKQAYKLELLINQKINNVFHMSLLEQDITRKERVEKALPESEKTWSLRSKVTKTIRLKQLLTMQYIVNKQSKVT